MISFPWPPAILSPNNRSHWARKLAPKQTYRMNCYMLTKSYLASARHWRPSPDCPLPVKIIFHPPDRRHRDDDNMISSFKSGRDGMADALGINDRMLRPEYHFRDPIKGGAVIVEVE